MKSNNHCCEQMNYNLEDMKAPLHYNNIFREYSIELRYIVSLQNLFYCPFCGTKLPSSLADQWFEILTQEYNISDPYDKKHANNIPEDFKTDKWWSNNTVI